MVRSGGSARLAPAYDQVPLAHQPTDGRLALAVNGLYEISRVTAADLAAEGASWGAPDPTARVGQTLDRLREALEAESALPGAYPGLRSDLRTHLERLGGS